MTIITSNAIGSMGMLLFPALNVPDFGRSGYTERSICENVMGLLLRVFCMNQRIVMGRTTLYPMMKWMGPTMSDMNTAARGAIMVPRMGRTIPIM